jgi:hypothetical protein
MGVLSSSVKTNGDSVSVSQTRIEGGAKAFQRVRVIYARNSVYFWLDVDSQGLIILSLSVT